VYYQHSHTKSKTQQLLGRKLTLPQPKPGHTQIASGHGMTEACVKQHAAACLLSSSGQRVLPKLQCATAMGQVERHQQNSPHASSGK